MTVISLLGSNLLDRVGASRAALAEPPGAWAARVRQGGPTTWPIRVTLGGNSGDTAVYSDPRAKPGTGRLWAAPVDGNDNVSALMARNQNRPSYALNDQWRGLGGALLERFGKTGEDYAQTVVDEGVFSTDAELQGLAPEHQARRAAEILARQAAALDNVATHASRAGLKIQTRSGQTVELSIAVNAGYDALVGMKVELKSSGAMSAGERAAVQKLADGLNRALEGLGRPDAVALDLSGLMAYDRGAIGSLDLGITTPDGGGALGSFSLHLGDDRRSVSLKGSDGEVNLGVDTTAPLGPASAPQRQAALRQTLDRIGSAGERGHANAALVQQMKAAFQQLQDVKEEDDDKAVKKPAALPAPGDARVASRLSGLADFDASFGGETWRLNRFGATNEAGQVDYQLSQKTTTQASANGKPATTQTVSEQLSADYRKAPGDRMLNVNNGTFAATRIRDSSTVTTLVDTLKNGALRVLRKTDEQQLKTVTDFENHRVTHQQSWPWQRNLLERLS